MGNNNVEVIIKTHSPVDRRRVKDRLSFFKQKYLDHNPERRLNMIDRRIHGDRRGVVSDIINTFWKEDL
jgi:hypothetical protein